MKSAASTLTTGYSIQTPDGIVPKDSVDVIDKFFGFTERMVCSSDNTTNVILDPRLLQKEDEERGGGFFCGRRNAAKTAEEELLFANMCPLMDRLEDAVDHHNDRLLNKLSDESGNTEVETVEESTGRRKRGSRRRRGGILGKFFGCKNREEVVHSVVVTEAK